MRFRLVEREDPGDKPARAFEPMSNIEARLAGCLARSVDNGATEAVDLALAHAAHYRASDVHFEPWEDCLVVRFRMDGLLHDVARLPKEHQARVIARLKVLARIPVYQKDTPRDGRIDGESTSCGRGMRVSTFPTVYGEKLVVRMLGACDNLLSLDSLGFRPQTIEALRDLVSRPQGTLLLTGPGSSGKTTTIYALLRELSTRRDPAPHIATIEDPVEYRLGNISQTEVKPGAGFTFEAALRAVLRQDPQVIMLGEIRDPETARTAIQAGLTGHLVISTIHSGTAAGVFARLLEMGVEPYLIASSVSGVLAQRLVRVICPQCKGVGACATCQGLGYSGRTAIGEMLTVSEEISELLLTRPRTRIIHEAAVRAGMPTLEDDANRQVDAGVTTTDEIRRVLPPPREKGSTG